MGCRKPNEDQQRAMSLFSFRSAINSCDSTSAAIMRDLHELIIGPRRNLSVDPGMLLSTGFLLSVTLGMTSTSATELRIAGIVSSQWSGG